MARFTQNKGIRRLMTAEEEAIQIATEQRFVEKEAARSAVKTTDERIAALEAEVETIKRA